LTEELGQVRLDRVSEIPATNGAAADAAVLHKRAWLTRNLKVLSWVSLLQDAASELLYPILPVFITVVLGAPVAVLGAIEGAASGLAAMVSPVAGKAADRIGRKPLIAGGYGLAAVGKLLIAVATVWPVALLARLVDRVGKGMRGAPRDALIADGVDPAQRGRAFGFHRAMDTLGAVIGPLIGLAAFEAFHHHIRPVLWFALIPAILSALTVTLARESRRAESRPKAPDTPVNVDADAPSKDPLPAAFKQVVAVLTVFSLVNFSDALLLLRLHDIGFSLAMTIVAYATYNVVHSLASFPAGALSDRLRRSRVYAVGLLFFAVGYLGLGATKNHAVAWLVLCVYGIFTACTDGVGKAWTSSLVASAHQGRAQGIYQGATGLAVVVAGVWAGLAWGRNGTVPLLVAGVFGAVFAAYLWVTPLKGATTTS
jgi:MFS family permease